MADYVYNKFRDDLAKALIDWTSGGITVSALLVDSSSTYVPSSSDNFLSDVTGNANFHELSGTGYARQNVTSRAVTRVDGSTKVQLTAANLAYTAINAGTIKAILVYKDTGTGSTSDLIAYIDSGGSKITNGGNLTIQWGADGVVKLA